MSFLRRAASRFGRHYGAGPWHLLLMLGCFSFAGYVASILVQVPRAWRIGVWFLGAGVFHDFVLWPVYGLGDRLAVRLGARRRIRQDRRRAPVPWINHVRVPVVLSGVLLIVSFPLVMRRAGNYRPAVGLAATPFTGRWLTVTGVLFGGSALLYGLRALSARRAK